jgi:hypothetical protein
MTLPKNYFDYSLMERINRKSHFSAIQDNKLEHLIHCIRQPNIFMQSFTLNVSKRIVLDGQNRYLKTNIVRVKYV